MLFTGIIAFALSLVASAFGINKIIIVAHKKHLFDEPIEDRKVHLRKTPNLGGVGIGISMLFTLAILQHFIAISQMEMILAGGIILFGLGLADDLVGLDPIKKLAAQIFASLLIVIMADLRIQQLDGFFGVDQVPYWVSVVMTLIFILFMTNAINLIDGINGLAGSLVLLASVLFAGYFWLLQDAGYFLFSIAVAGSTVGFLLFNLKPVARVFMGDTGSLVLGFILAIFSLRVMAESSSGRILPADEFLSMPVLPFVLSVLIVPIVDTSRVFVLRIFQRKSPFGADRSHLHHILLDCKCSHLKATAVLVLANLSCFLLAFSLRRVPVSLSILILVGYAFFLLGCLIQWRRKTRNKIRVFAQHEINYRNSRRVVRLFSRETHGNGKVYSPKMENKDFISN